MKLISANIFLICLLFACLACSSVQKANSISLTLENKPTNSPRISGDGSYLNAIADAKFANEWQEKYDATLAELERNRKLWQESKIMNYDFVIFKGGGGHSNDFRAPFTLIKIRNGEKSSMEAVEKDSAFNIESYNDFDTIDKLFDYLRQELDGGKIIEVKCDKKLGYPKMTYIKFSNWMHGTNFIEISKFRAI